MPNIKISDLEPIAGGFDPDAVFLEVQETVAGELVSRKISVTEVTAGAGPLAATYVTVTANAILPNERILTAGADIDIVDGGAGGNITISLTAGASYFKLTATGRVVGSDAGTSQTGDNVILGGALAGDVNIADGVIALGQNAFAVAAQTDFRGSIAIGRNAGALLSDTRDPWIIIGDGACGVLLGQSFHDGNTVIGTNALGALSSSNTQGVTLIGHDVCADMTGASGLGVINSAVVIGFDAGRGNVGASISSAVIIGRNACGDMGLGGVTGSVIIGLSAGESLGGAVNNVLIGSQCAPNVVNMDNCIVIGSNTAAFSVAQTENQIIIGHSSVPFIINGEKNILIGGSIGISGAQEDFNGCIVIGQGAGNDLIDDQDIFAIEQPQGGTSSLARPYLFGNILNGNLALLNIEAMTGGLETGTRIVPAWADAAPVAGQGVFSMYGAGTDLAATTDADFVHFYVASADSALTLRYPGGGDVTLLHDGTDSILDNSAGAMVINSAGIEGLRLTGLNSGVIQAPSASVAITANPGGGQGSAVALIHSYNVVSTVASFNDSVRLPDVFAINSIVYVKNDGANRLAIFPASGDDLGEGVDALISLPVGSSYAFIATVADSTWTLLDTNVATALLGLNNNGPQIADIQPTDVIPTILPNKTDANTGLGWSGSDVWGLIAGGVQALQLRELASGVLQAPSASLAVTAFAGGGQGSATALIDSYNIVTVVATAGDSVRLPDIFSANALVYIKNDDAAEACDVFPASGDDLGAGVDTAVSLRAGESLTFIATISSSTWTQLIVDTAGGAGVAGEFDNLLLSQSPGLHQASPTLRFGDGNTGFYERTDNALRVSIEGSDAWEFGAGAFEAINSAGPSLQNETPLSTNPVILPNKTDLNTGIGWTSADRAVLIAQGNEVARWISHTAGVEQFVVIQQDNATFPSLAFGDGDSGFYEEADDTITVTLGGTAHWDFNFATFRGNSGVSLVDAAPTGTAPNIRPGNADNNTGIGSAAADQLSLIAGGLEMLRLVETGVAATNQVRIAQTIGGAAATPAFAFGDGDTGFWENIDDVLNIGVAGSRVSVWTATQFAMDAGSGAALRNANGTVLLPAILPNKADQDTGLSVVNADQLTLSAGGLEMLRLVETGVSTTDQLIIGPAGVIGAVATPSLAFGDGNTGLFESADNILNIATAGAIAIQMTGGGDVALFNNGVETFRTDTTANGGAEVDAGDGFFRVLNEQNQELTRVDGDVAFNNDITSNAVADLTSSLIVSSGEHCSIEGMLRFESASATPGLRWQLDLTGAAILDSSVAFTLIIAGGTVEGDIEVADVDITHGMAANTEHVYKFFATFTANASILPTIAFAQEVSDGTTTRLLDGSWVKYSVTP